MPSFSRDFRGCRVLVWGLGRLGGGVGVTRWLVEQGADVTVMDRAAADNLSDSVASLDSLNVRYRLGTEDEALLEAADIVIVNPAIDKARSSFFASLVRRGVPWTTELNLFLERCPAFSIGVTGTYGKSTTAAMTAAALSENIGGAKPRGSTYADTSRGLKPRGSAYADAAAVFLGGNIGRSLLPDLQAMRARDWAVIEMSDAQLEDLPRIDARPNVAVITNVSLHHQSRHDSFEAYLAVKCRIVGDRGRTETVVLGPMADGVRGRILDRLRGTSLRVVCVDAASTAIELALPGRHNQANAQTALALCRLLGVGEPAARSALARFPGLPHRLQFVDTRGGVGFVNDSKSTSPSCTVAAVESFEQPLVVIVGGLEGQDALERCAATLVERCRAVICIGQSARRYERALRLASGGGTTPSLFHADDVPRAVRLAASQAWPGDVVLFSPGAASYDHYPNFEARGEHFIRAVHSLP